MVVKQILGGLIGLIIILGVVLPTTQDIVTSSETIGSISNEVWTGTANTSSALADYVISVSSMAKSTSKTATNTTDLINVTNDTHAVTLSTPIRNAVANLTVTYEHKTGENISVYVNDNLVGNFTSGSSASWVVPYAYLSAATTIKFVNDGNLTNVTNSDLQYYYWPAYANYTIDSGEITPLDSGTYLTTYSYGIETSPIISTALTLLVMLIAVLALVLVLAMIPQS